MSRVDELRRVASLVGIAWRHVDALGVWHEPDEEALLRLIGALGLPTDPDAAAAALAAEAAAAPLGLPALHVAAAEDSAPTLRLRVPPGTRTIEWQCRLEDGREFVGTGAAGDDTGPALALPDGLPLGYHRLDLSAGGETATIGLAVAPSACHLPAPLSERARSWGLTTQLYGLRSERNWGIGDFTDLATLGAAAGSCGAATVGLNPLHALFAAEPRHVSPYSPSSRGHLDYLYIDVTAVPGFAEDAAARALAPAAAIAASRTGDEVDHAAVAALKRPVLEALYRRLRRRRDGAPMAAFHAFQRERGPVLAAFATFEALHEHFYRRDGRFSWHDWPAPLRDPRAPAVAEFARDHRDRIEFFQFLQWQADHQLGAAAAAGKAGGLTIGLYRDAAVGVNPHGAAAWADQEMISPAAAIGAPPDPLSRAGQDWGLAPFNPLTLRRRGFAPFIAMLRANMRHAGLLRIDHVMALQRLYWIPRGLPAHAGAYVNYPFRELVRLLALESQRHCCAVVGEDLGTVPDGFREALRAADVLSYRIVHFERRSDASYIPPGEYPPLAAASAATHDLASVAGFWLGRDIDWRRRLKLYPDAAAAAAEADERGRDRRKLLEALAGEGLVGPDCFDRFLPPGGAPVFTPELGDAIHAFLARSRARLMLVQFEDVGGECEQANLPGTTDAHPNWRRRMTRRLEDLIAGPELARVAALVSAERRRQGTTSPAAIK